MDKQPSGTNYILILSVRGGSQLVGVLGQFDIYLIAEIES